MIAKLGIGVITFNRVDILTKTIENIKKYTKTDFELVVADDGSSDATRDVLAENGITYVTGLNRGISWNRNRALYYLKEVKSCSHIIIFEDDCSPAVFGWEQEWLSAIDAFGHVNYMPELTIEIDNDISYGTGTSLDPFIAPMHQALCVGYHARALSMVGYLDTRFKKYGEEHVEHTHRFLRSGYGGLLQYLRPERGQVYYIKGGLNVTPSKSHGDHEIASYNQKIHENIKEEPVYRSPWRIDNEMYAFREEMESALPRPSPKKISFAFDHVISLGGTENTKDYIDSYFAISSLPLFSKFITPFHSLVDLFETNFKNLLSTNCLYGYHSALRCRDSLLIYHNLLEKQPNEAASVEMFHAQLPKLKIYFADQISELNRLCSGHKRVLFIRDWNDSLLYSGIHKPIHSQTPDFKRLKSAISSKHPDLDFKILFVNYGDAFVDDDRLFFDNIKTEENADAFARNEAWHRMFAKLSLRPF